MDVYNDCPGYESFPHYEQNNHITTTGSPEYNIDSETMLRPNPVTPSSSRHGRDTYPRMSSSLITPYGNQHSSYPYANHGVSLQHTPLPAMMYTAPYSAMPAPELAAASYIAYNSHSASFSESNASFGSIDNSPALRAHGPMTPPYSSPAQSPQVSGRNMPTVPLYRLQYSNFAEAEAEASGRTPLEVDHDDWMAVAANKKLHVAAIMAAFDGAFRPVPNVALTTSEKARWVKYQTEQNEKVSKYIAKNPTAKEVSAWLLLEALLDIHKLGYKKGFRISEPDKCCSARFMQVSPAKYLPSIRHRSTLIILRLSKLLPTTQSFVSISSACCASTTSPRHLLMSSRARSPTGVAMLAR